MKYLSEYRHPDAIKGLVSNIKHSASSPWTIMEICGGQTHNIVKAGIDQALSGTIDLVHGPGCPVCVTPEAKIDAAISISQLDKVIVCSYGDMLRVPGSGQSLLQAKTDGADVRIIYSPMDALEIARKNPHKEVVFFAVGFETTAPANAMPIYLADKEAIGNFSVIVSHVLVPPAMRAILSNRDCKIQGFLAAGHVCTVTGLEEYHELGQEFSIPIVVTGFEPVDILEGISRCVNMLESKTCGVRNQYARSVRENGNASARKMIAEVFAVTDMDWRGMGMIPGSGLALKGPYSRFDAEARFNTQSRPPSNASDCHAGEVLQGLLKPSACPHFARTCHPETPLGAPMVSAEGACSAFYQYSRRSSH